MLGHVLTCGDPSLPWATALFHLLTADSCDTSAVGPRPITSWPDAQSLVS